MNAAPPVMAAVLAAWMATTAPAHAQQSPLDLLRQLIAPPATPPTATFRRPPSAAAVADMPLPRPRPARPASPPAVSALPGPALVRPPPAALTTCGKALAMMGVVAQPVAPIREGRCGIAAPVAVTAMGGGAIRLTATAIVACPTAEAVEAWLNGHVRPLARSMLGGDVTGLRVAASYACRSRNAQAGTRLSEHAKGNAIDISAFEVTGHGWIAVGAETGLRRRFLAAVRKSACGPFKTVLGPGSDGYHGDHIHLDLAQRRNGSTYCR